MKKVFLEVFPEAKFEGLIGDVFKEVEVERVSINKKRDLLRIYICSSRLIEKKYIFEAEQIIKKQLFPREKMKVKIMEKFSLSAQYTPKKLMMIYKESILSELKEYSRLEYQLFRTARIEYPNEDRFLFYFPKSPVYEGKTEELLRIMDKIFYDRCGLKATFEVNYETRSSEELEEYKEQKTALEVRSVIKHSKVLSERVQWEDFSSHDGEKKKEESTQERKKKTGSDRGKTMGTGIENKTADSFKGKHTAGARKDSFRRSDNPNVLYGRDFEEEAIPLSEAGDTLGEVVIRGKIISMEEREIRNEKVIVIFTVTDFTDSIVVKLFLKKEHLPELKMNLKKDAFVKIKGIMNIDKFDSELTISSVAGILKIPDFTSVREDNSPVKRVELHCHTKMSDMDGVSDVADIVKRAIAWGHKAIAITDHGVVQSFPEANHALPKGSDFKIIYGVEAYLVDDTKSIVTAPKGQSLLDDFVVFDIETTGFSAEKDSIIEIGAVRVKNGKLADTFSTFINPQTPIPFHIENLTGISDNMVLDAPLLDEALDRFMEFCDQAVMVAHNADFDMGFIIEKLKKRGIRRKFTYLDTVALARFLLPDLNRFKLDTVAKRLNISLENHHRAVDDAGCTAKIFVRFIEMLGEKKITTLEQLNEAGAVTAEEIKKLPTYHAIILATNDVGRINLYRLVSESHLTYYARRPRIPKSRFMECREGLLIGSACEAGELYQALLMGRPEEEIARLVNFYDYLEIQPIGNNLFMIESDKHPISSVEELQQINQRIVTLGEQFSKLVVGTCDVHFLDPEDGIYRQIIMAGHGFKNTEDQSPLYLRTTEEMLSEFDYLGSEKAEKIVITNPGKIADMCERISPVRPDKCPPVIEDSDLQLREICYTKAHEIYGEELPEVVTERLERELNSIISNGFAVMYIIAQKLVWKSNEDGYLVGSRGSVGSSFVATMAGITEVNPLRPHYYCSHCHYSDFDSEDVKKFAGGAGCDMPDKTCPVCGKPLNKEGFDIPFETFLGFKGNKEPDIDLNFSGEYQANAHKYTEVIFGQGQTFRAGTIGTLAEKTAFGYVRGYFEDLGIQKRKCEILRIAEGCVGVRRTTGQHPGGIIVLPHGEEIYSFTPVQHPANDCTTDIITTHFDYHSIDHNLLKLDILGHDDPTMIRMLEDLTGLDAKQIPLDDKKVMSLFRSTEALGVTPEDIRGCELGSLGIPEFGTGFVIQMLKDTKPECFGDLIRISGLSHGTDVWLGNAQTLIQEGKAVISTAICTRDDIMTYLIGKGIESETSFTIMESVRKGKGLKPEWEEIMTSHGVPDWYIWSCKKIKYMFPRAHAAAYVMMAWRIAYFKVYYPLAYYAAYFSIRASSFSYELMCLGKERLEYHMDDYEKRKDELSKKEQDTYKDMKIVQEMYARGFEFLPIDLYRAKASHFQIIDGKLMPSFLAIDGLGDKAAETVVIAAAEGKFLSLEDFRERAKVSKTIVELMERLGILENLPQTNQLSLFDYQVLNKG